MQPDAGLENDFKMDPWFREAVKALFVSADCVVTTITTSSDKCLRQVF